ncbi:MAG: hypothetical protein DRK00_02955 [Thermoprotei archaeon]|nr:MAG: hypothetical protein DRK00_02955 [Thermoprotei archaeon]
MGARRLARVSGLPREKLVELSSWLAEKIEELVERRWGGRVELVEVRVDISDEWPHVVEAEVNVRLKHPRRGAGDELDRILEEAFKEFMRKASEEGLRPVG